MDVWCALLLKFCKLPKDNPRKINGYERPTDDDRDVTLGTLCGYFHYVQGNPVDGRHEVEVYSDVEDDVVLALNVDDDGGDYCACMECGACKCPQKVIDACCKIAAGMGELGERGGRAGDYDPHCGSDGRGEVCCKCGLGNDRANRTFALNRVPTASSPCPGGPTDTTTEPPFMTMTTNQSPVTTEGQQPMTTSGATLTTAWFGTNPARTAIH